MNVLDLREFGNGATWVDFPMTQKPEPLQDELTQPTKAQIDKADKLAVQIVTLVCKRIYDGKLYAYDGIEAAREIRQLILDEMP